MPNPSPQRQALEKVYIQSRPWPAGKIPARNKPSFKSAAGTTLYLLGVSEGNGSPEHPNLKIAVFGYEPPARKKSARGLAKCQFGVITSGPDKDDWCWVEDLEIAAVRKNIVTLRSNGQTDQYRPTW